MNKALHLYWSKYSAKIIRRIVILIILLIAYALSYLVLKSEIIDIIPINKQYVVVLEKVKDSLHFIHPLHQEKNYRFKKIDIINFDTDTISLDFPVLQEKEYIGLITKHGDSFLNDLSYVKKRATVTGEVLTYIFKKYDDKNYNYYDNTLIHFAIDLRENRILWKHTIKNIYHRLSLFHDNETVFRQYNKNKKYHLEAINPKTGSILWAKNELKNELEGHIFIDNYLIFSSRHCTYIFNKKTGSLKKYYNRSYNKITHYKDFLYCDSSLSNSWYKIILKYKLKDEAQKANILFTNKIYTGYMLGAYKRNLLYTRLLPLSGYRDKNKFPVLTSYNLKNFAVNWEHEFKEYKGLDILDKPSSSQLFIYSANHHPLYKIRDRYMPVLFWGKARWTDSNNFQRLAICIIDMQTGKLLFKSKPVEMHHPYFFDHDTLYIHKEGEYYLVAPLKGEKNISLLIFNPNANIDAIKNRKEIDILNSFFTDSFQILYRKNKDFSLVFPAKHTPKALFKNLLYLEIDNKLSVIDIKKKKVVYGHSEKFIIKDTRIEVFNNLINGLENNSDQLTSQKIKKNRNKKDGLIFLMLNAVENNDYKGIKMLFEKGMTANTAYKNGYSILMKASQNSQKDMVNFLIKHGADVAQKAAMGYTALNYAIISNDVKIAKILLKNGADLNARVSIHNATPLMHAISEYDLKMVKLLLRYGAKVTKEDFKFAKKYSSNDILQILKKHL